MLELLNMSFNGANFIASFFLVLVVLYWITVIMGVLDLNFLDVDVEIDMDADVEVEVDADTGVAASGDLSWLMFILRFLNIGRVPLMLWFSFFSLSLWFVQVSINEIFGIESFVFGLLTLIPCIIGCAILAKFLTFPFVKMFASLEKESMSKDLTGSIGKVTLIDTEGKNGQAKVENNQNVHTIYIETKRGSSLIKGDSILVISFNKDQNTYLVEPYANA
ncbi:OB-fold-containig protein [Lishizhenia sp.]|uniref:OB-fold-containig protein n=1 Tax=Lishizhenia sp. TaxID=2497594 RepID=UPI00299D93F0|nr:OB-fold-containig protein [Lishizhenia sp.]MDX1446277.1 DUF1449 family protein [Lishizhenia sp.]